ncbi:MAG TPA: YidC/Oxa1 family membrane protein insertase [Dehalococcoidia bacterium]|nr:YidC/Oxa1 family membrane protein insertase [Dehalococcoidia bacterium]
MIGFLWEEVLIRPMLNLLVILTTIAFGNFGLGLILFTIFTRVVTFPLTLRQLRATRAMTSLKPRLDEINKKYKDPRRRSEEQMKLYREAGINPLGCLGPMLIQIPIFIALYAVVRVALGSSPESFISLEDRLYDWPPFIEAAVPLDDHFLGIDLGASGGIPLAILVGVATWLQSKTTYSLRSAPTDPVMAQQQQMMQWMLPLIFGYITITFPAGLGLYWLATTVIGIVLNYVAYGGIKKVGIPFILKPEEDADSDGASPASAPAAAVQPEVEQALDNQAVSRSKLKKLRRMENARRRSKR